MAWIESHQKLKEDPKLLGLCAVMDWNIYEGVGRLHCFWWWCVDHCEDGDLRRFNDAVIAAAVGLNPADGKRFVDALHNGGDGFIDKTPYFRVHNWWKFMGRFLRVKYDKQQEKWMRIKELYDATPATGVATAPQSCTTLPNLPNLPNQAHKLGSAKRDAEKEAMQRLKGLIGDFDYEEFGATWRERFRGNPGKFNRIMSNVEQDIKEGKKIQIISGHANWMWENYADK